VSNRQRWTAWILPVYSIYAAIVIVLALAFHQPSTLLYLFPPAIAALYVWLFIVLLIAAAHGWHGPMP
jgi:hypothetical protein